MSDDTVEELDGSELGTKDYWEKSYTTEIKNYKTHGDVGEVWFDEESQFRVIKWMLNSDLISSDDRIIDLGSGNGMMLIELSREGFTQLTGVDYSPKAVDLSQQIAADQSIDVRYAVVDLLSHEEMTNLGQFKVAHDKGTYDAISLHPDNPKEKRNKYIANVSALLQTDGLLILTSCNWTESELRDSFQTHFDVFTTIPTPTFRFGGKDGNIVTSIVFKPKQ